MKSLFSEMQRRNVFRTVLFYAAACWLLIQIAETVLPVFGVPDWVLRFLILALAAGLIPVVLLSWIYELTPEGIKKESEVNPKDSIAHRTGRKLGIATLVVLFAIALLTLFRYQSTSDSLQVASNLVQGVAVLPFDSISNDDENAFFATGVQEDVLTHLTSIQNLRVISRTSVKGYKDSTLQIPEIAKQLGVTHVVEGSVRRSGNKVRVTVQLIDGVTDKHVWAQNFDRVLDDIFEIQSEIAQKIVSNIKSELSEEEQQSLSKLPTLSTKAYEYYHRALAAIDSSWRSDTSTDEPYRYLRMAVTEDPDYLQAWLRLTETCGYAVWWEEPEFASCAREGIEQIERLAPDSGELDLAKGMYFYRVKQNYQEALHWLSRAVKKIPNSQDAWTYLGYVARRLNKFDVAIDAMDNNTKLDPRDAFARLEYVGTIQFSGNWERTLSEVDRAADEFPQDALLQFYRADIRRRYLGETDMYRQTMREMPVNSRWAWGNPFIDGAFTNDEERKQWIRSVVNSGGGGASRVDAQLGNLAKIRGESEKSEALFASANEKWKQHPMSEKIEELGPFVVILQALGEARIGNKLEANRLLDLYYQKLELRQDEITRNETGMNVVDTYLALNEPDKAWQEIKRMLRFGYYLTRWDLVHDLRIIHAFSELPEYQSLTADLKVGEISEPVDFETQPNSLN